MNRLALPAQQVSLAFSVAAHSRSFDVDDEARDRLRDLCEAPHATFAPIHYEPDYPYPLLVWLHGEADDERQVSRVMPAISTRNYVAIGPRGTSAEQGRRGGYRWRQTHDDVEAAECRVMQCIDVARCRYHVHAARVFLAGIGCGGTMAVRVAWNDPERFAGVATLGGPLPREHCPLRRVNALRQLPCFVAASRHSRQFPESHVCRDLKLLHSVGCTVDLRQYPGGDELTTDMLRDLNRWMMGLVTAAPSPTSATHPN